MNARSHSPRASELHRRWRDGITFRESGPSHSLRLALIAWLILGTSVTVRTLVSPSKHTVFPIFAGSAEHWWGNRPLYDLYPDLDRYRYPPVFALFVTPFSALGLTTGGILWSWLSIAVLLAGLWLYVRDVAPSMWTRQRLAVFLILGGVGALRGLWNAQSNALIAGFLLLGAAALVRVLSYQSQHSENSSRSSGWWLTAVLLAIPVSLKLTPLAPVLLLVALWPRQLAWRLLVVIAVLFSLPFLTRPPDMVLDQYREWIDHLMESGNVRWIGFRDGWTIWIVLHHFLCGGSGGVSLLEPMHSSWYHFVQLTAAVAALGWCFWQRRRSVEHAFGPRWLVHVTLSMGLAWLMLFGPAVEHATYVFLAPPLLWALLESRAWPLGRGLIWASFTLVMVLGWGAVTRRLAPEWPIVLTALPAGTALFGLWLVGYARNSRIQDEKSAQPSRDSRTPIAERLIPCTEQRNGTTIPS
ncbi:MAG TPA: glycosyltransferase family 87 protein [Gemmataceae bacterium]|jgi:hypothetical protein